MNKASDTMIRKYGKDYYSKMGKRSAKKYKEAQKKGKAVPRGFAVRPELARELGRKGGKISKRKKAD